MATALVTGASVGIGAAFTRRLARDGFDVVVVGRDRERLEAVADEVRTRHSVAVETMVADLSELDATERVAERLRAPDRPVDILVNNAGFTNKGAFISVDLDAEQRLLDVLVRAPMRLTHAALPGMIERRGGSVINVSSVASFIPGGTYSAAKAWLTVFSESVNSELRGTGVNVTALCPGYVHTEFHQRAHLDMSSVPEWLWLDADAVAAAALRDARAGRAMSVPGTQYKVLSTMARYAPRPVVRRVGSRPATNPLASRLHPDEGPPRTDR